MATLTVVPPQPLSLAAIEEQLAAYDNVADLVTPELEAEFQAEFSLALTTAVAKRDRVAAFLAHLEMRAAAADAEIKRLRERKSFLEGTAERIKGYVLNCIEGLGLDAKGKYRKLEGSTVTFSSRACPASVEVLDENLVPVEYKTITVTMGLHTWTELLDSAPIEVYAQVMETGRTAVAVSKPAVKAALEAGVEVPGVRIETDRRTLVRK